MPGPGQAKSSAFEDSILQQLNELDALMQRMLSMPVHVEETASPDSGTIGREPEQAILPVPGTNCTPSVPIVPPTIDAEVADFGVEPTRVNLSAVPSRADHALVLPRFEPILAEPPRPANVAQRRIVIVAWWLKPLWYIHDTFERSIAFTGPVAHWLLAPRGRLLLGVMGLLLTISSLVWFLWEGPGWIRQTGTVK